MFLQDFVQKFLKKNVSEGILEKNVKQEKQEIKELVAVSYTFHRSTFSKLKYDIKQAYNII